MQHLAPYLFACSIAFSSLHAKASEALSVEGGMTWTNLMQYNRLENEGAAHLAPRTGQPPEMAIVSQFDPRLTFTAAGFSARARPRLRLLYETSKVRGASSETHLSSRSFVREAFVQYTLSDSVSIAYGSQSFSWGESESLTPSNRIFPETAKSRDLLHEAQVRKLARVNFSFGNAISLILMTEYAAPDDDVIFTAEDSFRPGSLAKGEFAWNGGKDFFGLVVGGREHERPWLGEYFRVELPALAGWSLYGDAAHQRGANVWYPQTLAINWADAPTQTVQVFAKSRAQDTKIYTLAVLGLRYDFENGATLRGEYIHNEAGYSRGENAAFATAVSQESLARLASLAPEHFAQTIGRAEARGLELPGRRYAYVSMLWPKALSQSDLTLLARGFYSLTDRSAQAYGALEYALGDAGTALFSVSANSSPAKHELSSKLRQAYAAGYRHAW